MAAFPAAPPAMGPAGGVVVCVLGSGSRGNAVYVADGATAILVDAGFSAREIERRMAGRGLDPERLDALVVTHEHADHLHGAARLARRRHLPVHLSAGTLAGAPALGALPELRLFRPGDGFRIGTLALYPFAVLHDATEPIGLTIESGGLRLGIATDLGQPTAEVAAGLAGCRMLILESNHDPQMLAAGPYPRHLKRRIAGSRGHLSNPQSAALLAALRHPGLEQVVLAHLSATNNRPETALAHAARALDGTAVRLAAARQEESLPVIRLAPAGRALTAPECRRC